MPRAIVGDTLGPPEVYAIRERMVSPPGPGEVQIAIKAIGVSYVDVLLAGGGYQIKPATPYVPGTECAGVVKAVGEGVTHLAPGDRAMGSIFGGLFADEGTYDAWGFNRIPDTLSIEEGAVFKPNYATGYHALVDRGRLQPGEVLLVLGAAGGTGIAAIQLGKRLGAHVIASASTAEKRALCLRAGADAVVDTTSAAWRDDVKAAAGGRAVNVVFDPVGGDLTDPAFRTLGYDGRHLVVGFTGGIAALKTNLPLLKSSSLIGVQFRGFAMTQPEKVRANMEKCVAMAAEGALRPVIGAIYRFEDFRAAMTAAFAGEGLGRVVMTID